MENGELIVACDFGTTLFRALVVESDGRGGLRLLGVGEAPAAGFQDGDFVDLRSGSRAIARAVRAAEAVADVDISGFYYNIAGSHLRSLWARCQHQIGPGPREITQADMDTGLQKARSIAIPFDHSILVATPVSYSVDRVRGIVDPRGRIGSQLEVEVHLVTGSRSVLRNVERAVQMASYEVAGWDIDVLAAASALLTDGERREGVLLIDVGGRVTNWALFREGRIAGNGMVPWGGVHLTSDLAHGLRVGLDDAEAVKRERGIALRSLAGGADPEQLFDEDEPEATPGLIAAILEPRFEEILTLVKEDIGAGFRPAALRAGVVLTGGGSRCRGSDDLCEQVFALPTRLRYLPHGMGGLDALAGGQWATALGLLTWAVGQHAADAEVPAGDGPAPAGGLLRRLFGRARR